MGYKGGKSGRGARRRKIGASVGKEKGGKRELEDAGLVAGKIIGKGTALTGNKEKVGSIGGDGQGW